MSPPGPGWSVTAWAEQFHVPSGPRPGPRPAGSLISGSHIIISPNNTYWRVFLVEHHDNVKVHHYTLASHGTGLKSCQVGSLKSVPSQGVATFHTFISLKRCITLEQLQSNEFSAKMFPFQGFPYGESNPGLLGENQLSWPLDDMGHMYADGRQWFYIVWFQESENNMNVTILP